jgi:hypothetical protein
MAGLLDRGYSPDPLAMGLLGMGGALLTPRQLGGGIGPAMNAFSQQAMQAQMLKRQMAQDANREKLTEAQIKRFESDALKDAADMDARRRKEARDEEMRQMVLRMFGPQSGATNALATGAQQGSVGPTVANQQRMAGGQQGGFPLSLNDVVALKAAGGPDLLEALKFAKTPQKREGGSTYIDNVTGAETFQPRIPEGMSLSGGVASPVPGYLSSLGQITDTQEAAKAAYGPPIRIPTADGREQMVSPLEFARSRGAAPAAAGGAIPGAAPTGGAGRLPPGAGQGSPDTRASILNAELRKAITAGDPDTAASVERELDALLRRPPSVGQSNAVKQAEEVRRQRATATAGLDVKGAEGAREQASGAKNVAALAEEIEKLIGDPKNPMVYGNSPADRFAMGLNKVGGNETQKAVNTNQVRRLGQQLVLARGSLGAGVSVADAERYDKAAGDFSKAQTVPDMLASVQTMKEIAKKYSESASEARQQLEGGQKVRRYNPKTDRFE